MATRKTYVRTVAGMTQKTIKTLLKLVLVIVVIVVSFILFVVFGFLYRTRTIDRVYASIDDMEREPRTRHVLCYLPSTATDIRFVSKAHFGEYTDRFACIITESEFFRLAKKHSYCVATNSFIRLDCGKYEQEGGERIGWRNGQVESDDERGRHLVFGDAPAPTRFFSITDSHTFDGRAIGGSWLRVVVFDRDSGKLTGYVWGNLL